MIDKTMVTTNKSLVNAQKALEQAKNRVANEKKKANEVRRKFENRHKYMMGGVVHNAEYKDRATLWNAVEKNREVEKCSALQNRESW